MRALHFHLCSRDFPNDSRKFELCPFRRAKFAGANESEGEQFERRPCFRRAVIVRDGAKKPSKGIRLDDSSAMVDDGRGEGAPKSARRVAFGAVRCNGEAENLSDSAAKLFCSLLPPESVRPTVRSQNSNGS